MAWTGQCPDCREWNTLVEQAAPRAARKAAPAKGNGRSLPPGEPGRPVRLREVEEVQQRIIEVVRRMEEEGQLTLGDSGGSDMMV